MLDEMRQELNGVKSAVEDFAAQTKLAIHDLAEQTKLAIRDLSAQTNDLSAQTRDLSAQTKLVTQQVADLTASMNARFDGVDATTRNIAITVARHEDKFVQIDQKLKKLDKIDEFIDRVDPLITEVLAGRSDRLLMNRSFAAQQETLGDHEARIYRLEHRDKPS